MYLLDSNIIAEIRKIKSGKANTGVVNWIKQRPITQLYTCEIVIMEILRGIALKKRKDPVQAQSLQNWFDGFVLPTFSGRILTINTQTSRICATFHTPNPRPENDCWIAAIASANKLTLLTRNTKDFQDLPISIINPFQ
ncbi:type II toxin-antitoxin system VapC family toxin [Lonepinella koalarum]|uniref:type II toxin-antitoxin system VapC family toxin n=1 Tax=Lonepinella koalarum TaxID=53417 RepID=UPI003F6E25A8